MFLEGERERESQGNEVTLLGKRPVCQGKKGEERERVEMAFVNDLSFQHPSPHDKYFQQERIL